MAKATNEMSNSEEKTIPIHRWTHDGDKVLLVKCVERGGRSRGGFVWPRSGRLACSKAIANPGEALASTDDEKAFCKTGGLFGWPWGIGIGAGKNPDYAGDWIVFAADPQDVAYLCGKAKAVGEVEVVYYGDLPGALMQTIRGRIAWTEHSSEEESHSTGDRASASSTGDRASASSTGYRASASSTGDKASASSTGDRASASSTGDRASVSSTGHGASASSTGYGASASSTGYEASASSTGYGASASSTGDRASASSTGYEASASSTGCGSIAAITGENSTIEVGPNSLGAVTAQRWSWIVHAGAVVCCRWLSEKTWKQRMLIADELNIKDGQRVKVVCGEIQELTP